MRPKSLPRASFFLLILGPRRGRLKAQCGRTARRGALKVKICPNWFPYGTVRKRSALDPPRFRAPPSTNPFGDCPSFNQPFRGFPIARRLATARVVLCLPCASFFYFGPSEGLLKGWEPSEALSMGVKQLLGAFWKPLAFWGLVKRLLGAFWKPLPSRSPYPPGMAVKPLLEGAFWKLLPPLEWL